MNLQAECHIFPTVGNLWKIPCLLDQECLRCFVMHIPIKILFVLEDQWYFPTWSRCISYNSNWLFKAVARKDWNSFQVKQRNRHWLLCITIWKNSCKAGKCILLINVFLPKIFSGTTSLSYNNWTDQFIKESWKTFLQHSTWKKNREQCGKRKHKKF